MEVMNRLERRGISIETDSFRHLRILRVEIAQAATHRHQGVFINAEHLRWFAR
jgi:hypothetical protein